MAASQTSLLILIVTLLALLSSTPVLSATPPTAYDILQKFGLPKGLLPDSVTSYTFDPADNTFTVELKKPCYINFDYLIYYDTKITGKINYGVLTEMKGVQVQTFVFWLNVDGIHVDVPATGSIYMNIGIISKKVDIAQFETIHSCRDNALVACHHSSSLISQLPLSAEEVDKVIME